MTDIEELVRESLRTAPAATPAVSDPLVWVSARVRRARALWGRGLALLAIVVAAVVVPLSLRDSTPTRLVPVVTPAPTATSPAVWDRNATALAAGGGSLWELKRDAGSNNGSGHVIKLDPATHKGQQSWAVAAPYDFMAYGLGRIWIWGGGDGGYPDGLLQVVDPSQQRSPSATVSRPGAGFNGIAFLGGNAWATTGDSLWQIDTDGHVVSKTVVGSGVERIVAAGGSLWIGMPSQNVIQQVIPSANGTGPAAALTEAAQDGPHVLLGSWGQDQLIVSDGNDVRTEPVASPGGEGGPGDNAVLLEGAPTEALELPNGDLAVVVGADGNAKVYIVKGMVGGSCSSDCVGPALSGNVLSLAVNPAGGIDLVLDDGTAEHWAP